MSTRNTTPPVALHRVDLERCLKLDIFKADRYERAVELVESAKVQAFAMDDVLLYGMATGRADPKALKLVGWFFTTEPLAIMLPKDESAFTKIIDDEMRRLEGGGALGPA
ncbi:transporter substrate-binding domain-containing protein [Hydrogenophaga sp.]|uniref:transporter substrate-binding domain-containing protein n=1 Tax=Hydrogenophaga sp. TaxID=1904254 RepID=UPI00351F68B6